MTDHDKDRQYLHRLQDYYAEQRSIPAYSRLMAILGVASKSAVKKVLERLQKEEFLERTPDEVWIPGARFFERSLSEVQVPAGMPVTANDVGGDPFYIDNYLVRKPSRTSLIPVKGDSMCDAGIYDGDVVVIERDTAAIAGDFVVAIVDNEFTLKELATERGQFILKPHNKAYPIIRPRGQLEIFGVMVGLARRYKN